MERLTPEQGLALFSTDLLELGERADQDRRRRFPDNRVTFVRDRIINYTNVCITYCKFCAFYRPPGHEENPTCAAKTRFFVKSRRCSSSAAPL